MGWRAKYGRYSAKDAVERGRTRKGQAYIWGEWDCSAFVSWCYFDGTVRWTTSAMKTVNPSPYGFTRIPIGEVTSFKAGDILYYDTGLPDHSHTGMMTGPSTMIQQNDPVNEHGYYDQGWEAILRPKDGIYIEKWTGEGAFG